MSRRWRTATATLLAVSLALRVSPAIGEQPDRTGARAVEVRVIEHDEFRWADAAIGALAGFGLAAICAGVLVTSGRTRRSASGTGSGLP